MQNNENSIWFGFAASFISMIVIFVCDKFRIKKDGDEIEYPKKPESATTPKKSDNTSTSGNGNTSKSGKGNTKEKNIMLIFSALYAIVAGVAITHGFDTFLLNSNTFKQTNNFVALPQFLGSPDAVLFLSFLSIAILYYHGGLLYLSSDAVGILARHENKGKRKEEIIFSNVLIMFAESVILYFIADSITDLNHFILWVAVLMSFDLIWIFVQRFIFTEHTNTWKEEIPFEWLHFAFLILFFVIVLARSSNIPHYVYWLLLIILGSRTIIDYIVNWSRVWSKVSISN